MSTNKFPTCHFRDGQRKIDFVFVFTKKKYDENEEKKAAIDTYVKNLEKQGLETEKEQGKFLEDLLCVKIHAPDKSLATLANQQKRLLIKDNQFYSIKMTILGFYRKTILTDQKLAEESPFYQRAKEPLSFQKPTTITTTERITIVNKVMTKTKFGDGDEDVGYENMIKNKIIAAAYPLHDTPCKWPEEGPISERQLLHKYWANMKYCFTQQPLYMIHSYFGSEVAVYFTWISFYTKMLLTASVLGILCVLYGAFLLFEHSPLIHEEICSANFTLCPLCKTDEECGFFYLKHMCYMIIVSNALDNYVTVINGVLISVWGIVFVVLWKRKQALLRLKWCLRSTVETELFEDNRRDFETKATLVVSSVTGISYKKLPMTQLIGRKIISIGGICLLVFFYCLVTFLLAVSRIHVMYYLQNNVESKHQSKAFVWEPFAFAALTFVILSMFYIMSPRLCFKLTEFEMPQTQMDFERIYVIRSFFVVFFMLHMPLMYIAYIKGIFYEFPSEEMNWDFLGIIKSDVCMPYGCQLDVSIMLLTIMTFKNLNRHAIVVAKLIYELRWGKTKAKKQTTINKALVAQQWEEDFLLIPPNFFCFYSEYIEMAMQYSLITFFVSALPFIPAIAYVNNIFEIRTDARKFTSLYRRPVPRDVSGIGGWNTVLLVMTIGGTISNSYLLAFTSNIVSYTIFNAMHSQGRKGFFLNSVLSVFSVNDFKFDDEVNVDVCYYYGQRYPPDHPKKYELRDDYWTHQSYRCLFFIIVENICLIFSLLFQYAFPEYPEKVKLKMAMERNLILLD